MPHPPSAEYLPYNRSFTSSINFDKVLARESRVTAAKTRNRTKEIVTITHGLDRNSILALSRVERFRYTVRCKAQDRADAMVDRWLSPGEEQKHGALFILKIGPAKTPLSLHI